MTGRVWKSVYDIPFDVLFRGLPEGSLTWRRFTGDTCLLAGSLAWVEHPHKLDAKFPDGFIEVCSPTAAAPVRSTEATAGTGRSLADQIRIEAGLSDRPGQMTRLDAIADRVAELEHERSRLHSALEDRDELYERVGELELALEATQRPPLAYVVGRSSSGDEDGPSFLLGFYGSEAAAAETASLSGPRYFVGGVREVRP